MDFLATYGMFLAKTLTFLAAILAVMAMAMASTMKDKQSEKGSIKVTHLNEKYEELGDSIKSQVIDAVILKQQFKAEKKKSSEDEKIKKKAAKKAGVDASIDAGKKRLYILDFEGDAQASQVEGLRLCITAILEVIRPEIDEVLLRLESPGGMVHAYGLAASQLERLRKQKITLTICVDKVAASGGYMMACLGSKIVAAPFAYIGSIGVVLQMPNFHRLLKQNSVDYETITGGEYKRTLTVFGENTDKAREKVGEEIQETHALFKAFVNEHRPSLNIDEVSTGETWFGRKALEKNLIDAVSTSDECIVDACQESEVYAVNYEQKKNFRDRLGLSFENSLDKVLNKWLQRSTDKSQFLS